METTIKLTKETKERLLELDLAEKGKTFDMIVNELITSHQKISKGYKKDRKEWGDSMKEYKIELEKYKQRQAVWDKLLLWAKKQGFNP